ncbi:MAG: acyltransferase [Pseudomonadota bacterium]
MTAAFSLYLDALRALAAFVVVLSHLAYVRFTDGRYSAIENLQLGRDAVIVFFVVSGYVIAFSAAQKDKTLASFALARITRFASVVIPALLIGFALDVTGARLYPEFYNSAFYQPITLSEQLLRGLTFSNEWYWFPFRLGSNGPYWSLSYEAAFYIIFAIAAFTKGWKRTVYLICTCVLFGPNILLLLPCWLIGVWLYHRCLSGQIQTTLPPAALIYGPVFIYVLAQLVALPDVLRVITAGAISVDGFVALRFSGDFLWHNVLAMLCTLHLLGVYLHSQTKPLQLDLLKRPIRFLASASFSTYVLHYPVMQFLRPSMQADLSVFAQDLLLLGTTLMICLVFAAIFERSIDKQRLIFRTLFGQRKDRIQPPSS